MQRRKRNHGPLLPPKRLVTVLYSHTTVWVGGAWDRTICWGSYQQMWILSLIWFHFSHWCNRLLGIWKLACWRWHWLTTAVGLKLCVNHNLFNRAKQMLPKLKCGQSYKNDQICGFPKLVKWRLECNIILPSGFYFVRGACWKWPWSLGAVSKCLTSDKWQW